MAIKGAMLVHLPTTYQGHVPVHTHLGVASPGRPGDTLLTAQRLGGVPPIACVKHPGSCVRGNACASDTGGGVWEGDVLGGVCRGCSGDRGWGGEHQPGVALLTVWLWPTVQVRRCGRQQVSCWGGDWRWQPLAGRRLEVCST